MIGGQRVAAILLARSGSTRFPGKPLQSGEFGGYSEMPSGSTVGDPNRAEVSSIPRVAGNRP